MTRDELCKNHKYVEDAYPEHDDGWVEILDKAFNKIEYLFSLTGDDYGFKLLQIKEKFGVLVIYHMFLEDTPEYIRGIVDDILNAAMRESKTTCEHCGSRSAQIRTDSGWMHTYCDECEIAYKKKNGWA